MDKEPKLHDCIEAYKASFTEGQIQKGYQGLIQFMLDLRTHFANAYPKDYIVGQLYQGYMDMTYFPFTPSHLKQQKLKIGIVLIHETVQFEIALLGQNKAVQKKYWQRFKDQDLTNLSRTGTEYVLKETLVEKPNFNDLGALTQEIETKTIRFIQEIEQALA